MLPDSRENSRASLQDTDFTLENLRDILPGRDHLLGVLLFGSRVTAAEADPAGRAGDWDIGLVMADCAGPSPGRETWPANWDVFIWKEARWRRGFALQLELARTARVLYDPLHIIQERFDYLRAEVLPRWGKYLKR